MTKSRILWDVQLEKILAVFIRCSLTAGWISTTQDVNPGPCLVPCLNNFLVKVSGTVSGMFCSVKISITCSWVSVSRMSKIWIFGQVFVVGWAVSFSFLNSADSPSWRIDGQRDSMRTEVSRQSTILWACIPSSRRVLDVRIFFVSSDVLTPLQFCACFTITLYFGAGAAAGACRLVAFVCVDVLRIELNVGTACCVGDVFVYFLNFLS
jgi:hypothetical protein